MDHTEMTETGPGTDGDPSPETEEEEVALLRLTEEGPDPEEATETGRPGGTSPFQGGGGDLGISPSREEVGDLETRPRQEEIGDLPRETVHKGLIPQRGNEDMKIEKEDRLPKISMIVMGMMERLDCHHGLGFATVVAPETILHGIVNVSLKDLKELVTIV